MPRSFKNSIFFHSVVEGDVYQLFWFFSFSLVVCLYHPILWYTAYISPPWKAGFPLPIPLLRLWLVLIIRNITAWGSDSLLCTLHHFIIIMTTNMKALNIYYICQVYSAECVSRIKSILPTLFNAICGYVCFQLTRLHEWLTDWLTCCVFFYYWPHNWLTNRVTDWVT